MSRFTPSALVMLALLSAVSPAPWLAAQNAPGADSQGDEWQELEPRKAQYVWRSRFALTPANQVGTDTLLFNTYQGFLR